MSIPTKNSKPTKSTPDSNTVIPAQVDWQTDATGHQVPVSGEFGDVYYSHADGLAESRYVFLDGNHLPERLTHLRPYQSFSIAELGFGTGLNVLALWHLWRELRSAHTHLNTARLHIITTEKHPIPIEDLTKILSIWCQRAPKLSPMVAELLAAYPILIAGCHRLNFTADNLTLDIWLGDASDSLAKLATDTSLTQNRPYIDAWFLDGFAPSCNESLWAQSIFTQIQRLSSIGTTAATYSCAGVVKRGLQHSGFELKKIKGFGPKNEMLTAAIKGQSVGGLALSGDEMINKETAIKDKLKPNHTLIIGAGVSGLMVTWSLANRGIKVTIVDKVAPLAGASGNPRALLAPKMTPIHHADEHLHTIGYLYSSRLYRKLNEQASQSNSALVLEPTGALDLLLKANINVDQITNYPDNMATTLTNHQARQLSGLSAQDLSDNLYLAQSGLVNPQALKDVIMSHPLISYQQLAVNEINETNEQVYVSGHRDGKQITLQADNVIICAAFESHQIDARIFDCRKIRGQLSWFIPSDAQLAKLPNIPLKYSGYCTPFIAQAGDNRINSVVEGKSYLLLGASFVRNDIATDIRANEHQISRDKLVTAITEMDEVISTDTSQWQARAGVRTQTPDYHPIVGQLPDSRRLWVMSAMGAKGYAYAPICAEALADMMIGDFAPLSSALLGRLSPDRKRLQMPLDE